MNEFMRLNSSSELFLIGSAKVTAAKESLYILHPMMMEVMNISGAFSRADWRRLAERFFIECECLNPISKCVDIARSYNPHI